ncbi:hypothetical protein COCON_G00094280 [Conger conger]|uniref:Uncharacterized protein n=1 Tax=Conger conger TaxID=82655 RepID=A0A9Q1DLX4_CONCO|nr:hypothetical protein COCON_G00094280 [Conger conger]
MQLSNQPIVWQQCNEYNHVDTDQELQLMFTSTIRMGKDFDLSDRGMIVGGRQGGLTISKTADLLGFLRTPVSRAGPAHPVALKDLGC